MNRFGVKRGMGPRCDGIGGEILRGMLGECRRFSGDVGATPSARVANNGSVL